MNRNPLNTETKQKNKEDILKILLDGVVSYEKILTRINFKHATLSKHLTDLENEGLIKHILMPEDRRKRSYKITKRGLAWLNGIDTETKGKIFTLSIIIDFVHLLGYCYIYDTRLPDETWKELLNIYTNIPHYIEQKNKIKVVEWEQELLNQYIIELEKRRLPILEPSELILRKEFFEVFSKIITESIMYITIKSIEEKKPEMVFLLSSLPTVLANLIEGIGLPIEQFKGKLATINVLEDYYLQSQTITPEKYRKVKDEYANLFKRVLEKGKD